MGTSTGYTLPTGGNWGTLKGKVTNFGKSSSSSGGPGGVLGSHRDAFGFGRSSGGGGRGGGAGRAANRSAGRAAARLGGLISDISSHGRDEALREHGLERLIGQPVDTIIDGLTEYLLEGDGSIEDGILRSAVARFWEEVFADHATIETLDELASPEGLENWLGHFLECYIYEHFLAVHYESLLKTCGSPASAQIRLVTIREWINSHLKVATHGRDLADVRWREPEGQELVAEIQKAAWEVVGSDT